MAKSPGIVNLSAKSPQHPGLYGSSQGIDLRKQIYGQFSILKTKFSDKGLWHARQKLRTTKTSKKSVLLCQSTETHSPETKQSVKHLKDCSSILRYVLFLVKFLLPTSLTICCQVILLLFCQQS